eukprot:SAG22_NODE_1798_length_3548_cov_39.134532_2_plen_235_part_00
MLEVDADGTALVRLDDSSDAPPSPPPPLPPPPPTAPDAASERWPGATAGAGGGAPGLHPRSAQYSAHADALAAHAAELLSHPAFGAAAQQRSGEQSLAAAVVGGDRLTGAVAQQQRERDITAEINGLRAALAAEQQQQHRNAAAASGGAAESPALSLVPAARGAGAVAAAAAAPPVPAPASPEQRYVVQDCNSGPLPLRMSSKSFPVCVLDHKGRSGSGTCRAGWRHLGWGSCR